MPLEIVFLNTMEMLLPPLCHRIGAPLVRVFARGLDRRDPLCTELAKIEERLGRLEAGIDSIAWRSSEFRGAAFHGPAAGRPLA